MRLKLRITRSILRPVAAVVAAVALLPAAPLVAAQTEAGTPPAGAAPEVVRTLRYRDLTSLENGVRSSNGGDVVLSDDGSTAIFVTEEADAAGTFTFRVHRLAIDGGEPEEIAALTAPTDAPAIDVSADGSQVLLRGRLGSGVNPPNEVRIVDEAGERTIVEEGGVEMGNAVISGDGETVFFNLRQGSTLARVDGTATNGIWRVEADGSGLRQIVAYEDVLPLTDAAPEDSLIFSETTYTLDASADGGRIAFTVVNYFQGKAYLFGADGDGGDLHMIGETTAGIFRATISGDGSTVLCICRPSPSGSGPQQLVVFPFAGGEGLSLAESDSANERGAMLNDDGSRALDGSNGVLHDTADGAGVALGVDCDGFGLVDDELYLAVMNAEADRVLYVVGDAAGQRQLALVEIAPGGHPAAAGETPELAEPTVDPPFIVANDGGAATVTALVDAPDASVCATVLVDGFPDANRFNFPTLNDGGPEGGSGDTEAGDGLFTAVNLFTFAEATGPATVRVKAEVQIANGLRSAVAVDLEPFAVVAAPPAATPAD